MYRIPVLRMRLPASLVALAFTSLEVGGLAAADSKVDFNRDIRPILASKCYACHGPDEDKREGGLRLDLRDEVVPEAIVPGKPETSEVWARIITEDPDDVMPPLSSPKQLKPAERELVRRWIAQGAEYQAHWSFLPIKRPTPPAVKHREGMRNDIDAFIRAALERHDLQPAPEAEAATLIRRVSLDLTGLPPTLSEVDAFVRDRRPDAYERLVDRLLDSPHFGERWGRHWLDMARYADSNGFLGDGLRPNAWRYRDWVISAFNDDLPFDRFTIEQLAGDLLPEATASNRAATGFHRNAAINTEAGVDKEDARFQNLADRVNTTGRVWMGLTLGCAQCHTHKYDPITIRDYYGVYAFFNNTADRDEGEAKTPTLKEVEKDRRETYVHLAGDYSRRGPTVVPASLSALPSLQISEPREATRLDFAKWLVSPQHPLTSRVAVNHIWSKLFGVGIVATPDDFGVSGDSPSHPELLDWLATEFMERGWSRKQFIRLVVTSATYRQSSAHRDDLEELDPLNRLLARQNRLRLEAEVLRDVALTTSGLLTRAVGGASIRPPLPGDIFDVGRSVKWEVSQGSERYRRGLYILTMRSVLYPMLTTFDAPDAADACVRRERSNTPLQALTMMNDPVFVEATQALALRVLREGGPDTAARARFLFKLCTGREPRPDEIARLDTFRREQLARVRSGGEATLEVLGMIKTDVPKDAAEEAAVLVAMGRVLMNLDECINRE